MYPQPTPIVYYVDNVSGLDTNNGSVSAPWATITHAITQVNAAGHTAEIRIRGQLSGGVPKPYDETNGETFPLIPKRGVSLIRDPGGSGLGVPVIIRSSQYPAAPTLVRLGQAGLSDYSHTKLRQLTFEAATGTAVQIAPEVNGQSLSPTVEICRFDGNTVGLQAMSGRNPATNSLTGTSVAPTVRTSTFTFTSTSLSLPVSHLELLAYTDGSNTTQGSIQGCTMTMDSGLASSGHVVTQAVRIHGRNGGQVSTPFSNNQIDGQSTDLGIYGIKYGIHATTTGGSTMPFTWSGGAVRHCGMDGIFMKDSADLGMGVLAYPRVEFATIEENGLGYPNGSQPFEIHGSGIAVEADNGRLSPTIADNTPGSGIIQLNHNHNIAVRSAGPTGTRCAPVIKNNTIFNSDDQSGILLWAHGGLVAGKVDSNLIDSNRHDGIHCAAVAQAGGEGGPQAAKLTTVIVDNRITNTMEGAGIRNERISSWGVAAAQARPTITHNTVCYGYENGLNNTDAFTAAFGPAACVVYNSIFFYNQGSDVLGVDAGVGQIRYCDWATGVSHGGYGNINAPPVFADSQLHLDPVASILLIDEATTTPPDAPSVDFEGDPRTVDLKPGDPALNNDMGADEVTTGN